GTNTSLPWGMSSNQTDYSLQYVTRVTGLNPDLPVHPTFFYEFAANLLIFFWLLRVRKKSTFPLQTTLWYLLLYGMVRYFVESIRTDPLVIGNTGIRISMLLSALMVVGSIVFLIVLKRRQMRLELTRALSADDSETSAEPAPEDSEDASADFVAIEDELPAKPADPDKPASP
ncbi:MAG: prolipoprotein diacylglyceryl transferase, partial [Eubacteriales bacterium]|nr:prolipoprotein diacylglyceryl transferase [Eubacteriales bacterium]